jgi:GTPase
LTSSPGKPADVQGRLPRVAILGRTNVGKSTLFNALLGRRRAIMHSQPGVTRDPVEVECSLGGRRLVLVDTGGWASDAEGLDGVVAGRSLAAAKDAELLLLVLDAAETTPEDAEIIRRLRPFSKKLLLVVNKVDTPDKDTLVWNAHRHGFASVIGVSAAHGRSLDRLKETVAEMLDRQGMPVHVRIAPSAGDDTVRIAILGKPNTGKSSLANRFTGEERSIVSPIPGTTRDVVEGQFSYHGRTFQILDTAGIRRKSKVTDSIEYYSVNRAIESVKRSDVVFLMIDATEGLVDQDKKIAAQAVKEGRGIVIVLSKWDLVEGGPKRLAEVRERVHFDFPMLAFAPVLPVSALTGHGARALLDCAAEVWDQLHKRVGTGRLNQALKAWTEHYRLPVRGKNYKIQFMTQTSTNPLGFVAFVNRMTGFPTSYTQYLENCIRRDFDVPSVPVSIAFRQSKKKEK